MAADTDRLEPNKEPQDRLTSRLRFISRVLLVLLWVCTLVVAFAWLLDWELPYKINPEPATIVLGMLSAAVTALLNSYTRLVSRKQEQLEEERYSISYALAYGYMNNFIEPVITQLLVHRQPADDPPLLYVYIPAELSELSPQSIERTVARIRARQYRCEPLKLESKEGRIRDLLTICKTDNGTSLDYFDFPTTLLTLTSYVDYMVATHKNNFKEDDIIHLGKRFIQKFHQELVRMLQRANITEYVSFTDRNLDFLDGQEGTK